MEPFSDEENKRVVEAIKILEAVKGHKFESGDSIEGFELTFINKKTGESRVIKI